MSHRFSLCLVVVALSATSASAQTTLEWKLKEGETFFLEEQVVQVQKYDFMGKEVTQKMSNRTLSRFKVLKATKQGVVLEKKIESWTNKVEGGLVPQDDDKFAKAVKGLTFNFHLSASGAVTAFTGFDGFVDRLKDLDPMEAQMIKLILTEDALKSTMDMAFGIVPDRLVNIGDSWQKQLVVPAGPIGTVRFDTKFTYEGNNAKGEENVSALGKFTYELPKKAEGLPFRVVKANFKSPGGKGTIFFDAAAGRLRSFEMQMPMSGTMTLEVAGMQIDVSFLADETRTMRLTPKDPTGT